MCKVLYIADNKIDNLVYFLQFIDFQCILFVFTNLNLVILPHIIFKIKENVMNGDKIIPPELDYLFINPVEKVHYQHSVANLVEDALRNEEGSLAEQGALTADTGRFTGRSPHDRFIVCDEETAGKVWWGEINQPILPEYFEQLLRLVGMYLSGKKLYVRDAIACADPEHQLGIRAVTETAYQSIFVNNMFIRPATWNPSIRPEWSIVAAPGFVIEQPGKYGLNNPNFVIISFSKKIILIGGTGYTGEIKKGIFSVLNFILPLQKGILSMHCSANTDSSGHTALFFGLSGTGKTTLSADKGRFLIGDDEHGWDDKGIFNFEGGCYAKCVGLDAAKEPEIYHAVRFGALLENINFYQGTRRPDFDNISKTENTRVAYPVHYIQSSVPSGMAGHPGNIFFLTADAFGVIPPISRLSPTQAMYHFISGYTAKVAGTEVGVHEPKAVFSACFGQAFLPLHPSYYAELLRDKLQRHRIQVWLVNTGWIAGPYGVGRRIPLNYTRSLIRAALNGELNDACFNQHPVFGLLYPDTCPDVPDAVLNPVKMWANEEAYYVQANKLARLFTDNFRKYAEGVSPDVLEAAPKTFAGMSL